VAAGQPEQAIDLAHLGPGQRVLEDRCRVAPDVLAVARGATGQPVEVAQGVGADLVGQVGRVGVSSSGLLARVDFEQLPAVIELDGGRVGAGQDAGPDQLARHRVERAGDFDMAVPGDLRGGEHRDRERRVRCRPEQRRLLLSEHLGRASPGAAMDAHAGDLRAPVFGAGAAVGQVEEVLAGEEVPAHVLHRALDAGLVLRVANPSGVDHEASRLGVLAERVVEPRVERVGLVHDRLEVVGNDHREHPTEERPRGVEPGDHLVEGLAVGREHEQVPRVDRGEDQPVGDPPGAARQVGHQPESAEVDLQLHPRVAVGDRHRRAAPPEPELGDREAMQRAIGHRHPAALKQHMGLGQRQALLDPGVDLLAVRRDRLPGRAGAPRAVRAHRRDHCAQQLVAELAGPVVAVQPSGLGSLDIAADGLAVRRGQ
jgi:hypothetical protein